MAIFPQALSYLHPLPVISTFHAQMIGPGMIYSGPTAAAYPTANKAFYYPLTITHPYTVKTLWWANGTTVTGTVDVAVYDETMHRLTSMGPQNQTPATAIQQFTLVPSIVLQPGQYFLGISCLATTDNLFRSAAFSFAGQLRAFNSLEQTSAHPLPAVATPVAITANYLPIFGIASRAIV
jgi:hypothetical protein